MKSILLASALMISGVAFAQADPRDAGQPIGSGATLQPGTTMGERDTMGPAPAAGTATTTTTTTMPAAPMSTDTSMGATTMGTTGSGTVATVQEGGNMSAPPASTGPYPRCSRTITDHCVQSSARESDTKGGPPARRRTRR
jgi:hypothetical protein